MVQNSTCSSNIVTLLVRIMISFTLAMSSVVFAFFVESIPFAEKYEKIDNILPLVSKLQTLLFHDLAIWKLQSFVFEKCLCCSVSLILIV